MSSFDDKELDNQTLSQLMDGEWKDLKAGECLAGVCKSRSMKGAWERYHLIRDVIRNEPVAPATTLCDRISAAIADEPTYSNVHSIGSSALPSVEPLNYKPLQAEPMASAPFSTAVNAKAALNGAALADAARADTARTDGARTSAVTTGAARADAVPVRSAGMRTAFRGFALAASVALMTVLGLSVWQGGTVPETGQVASNVATEVFSRQVPGSSLPEVDFVANSSSYWVSPETTERSPSEGRLNMFLSQHIEHSPAADHQGMFPYSRLVGYEQQVAE